MLGPYETFDSDDHELIAKQWPGFVVVCLQCQSTRIELKDSRGWSEVTGPMGHLELLCHGCDQLVVIADH